jgi:hypothetical protein
LGEQPASYPWIRAAKYLGVPVWDLIERDEGRWWMVEALKTEANEIDGNEARQKLRGMNGQRLQA